MEIIISKLFSIVGLKPIYSFTSRSDVVQKVLSIRPSADGLLENRRNFAGFRVFSGACQKKYRENLLMSQPRYSGDYNLLFYDKLTPPFRVGGSILHAIMGFNPTTNHSNLENTFKLPVNLSYLY